MIPVLVIGSLLLLAVLIGLFFFSRGEAAPSPAQDPEPEPAPQPKAPEAPEAPESSSSSVTAMFRLGEELWIVDAECRVGADGHVEVMIRDEACPEGDGLDLRIDSGNVTATVTLEGRPGALFDAFTPAILRATTEDGQETEIVGVQGAFSFPLRGQYHRLRDCFIGFPQDPDLAKQVIGLLDPGNQPDGMIPWTLDGATRFVLSKMEQSPGIKEAVIVAPGKIAYEKHGMQAQLDLGNVFREVERSSPNEGRDRLEHFVGQMMAPPPGQPAKEQVLLRVYEGSTPYTISPAPGVEMKFSSYALSSDLVGVFVHDTPEAIRPLPEDERLELVSDEEALDLAAANLLRELPIIRIRGEGPAFMLIAGGNYEASLTILPSLWEAIEPLLDGPPLIAMPARDVCLICGDGEDRREYMKSIAGRGDLSYAISDGVYTVHDQGRRLVRVM